MSVLDAAVTQEITKEATVPVAAGSPTAARAAKRTGRTVGRALLSLAVALAVWQLFIVVFKIDPFIARGPLDTWKYVTTAPAAAANRSVLIDASLVTLLDAALGFIAGTTAALAISVFFSLRRGVEQTMMPVAMALRSVPLVAMTPLIALIFGRGLLAVTIIAGIVTFFPTLVNVSVALKSVPPHMTDLMSAYGATPWATVKKVQFPWALPAVFASMRIAAPLAIIGALLAEWLATGKGLGYLMLSAMSTFQVDRVWASVAIVTIFSVLLYNVINAIESVVLAKYAPEQSEKTKLV